MMLKESYSNISFLLLKILQQEANHPNCKLSLNELIAYLNLCGYDNISDKTIRKYLHLLKANGYNICFDKKNNKQGYYLNPLLKPGETYLLINSLRESKMITDKRLKIIENFLFQNSLISTMPFANNAKQKTNVVDLLDICLKAIMNKKQLQFHYFDYDIYHRPILRHDGKLYNVNPYAIHSYRDHYYLIAYIEKENEIRNYRLDKILHLKILTEDIIYQPFQLDNYLENNFNMFKGHKEMVLLNLKKKNSASLISDIYEKFDKITILKSDQNDTYKIAIQTAITPPFIDWLIHNYELITILEPLSLIDEVKFIAQSLVKKYQKKE